MHQYRHPSKKLATAFIAVQTVVISWILVFGRYADLSHTLEVAVKVFGSSGLLFGLWELFSRRVWKWRIFRWLGLVDFPNLDGTWVGNIRWQGRDADIPATFKIKHTYTAIYVSHQGVMSVSRSLVADLAVSEGDLRDAQFQLVFIYKNERTAVLRDSELQAHGWKPHIPHRGAVALNVEGSPPKRLIGAIWTEATSEDPKQPHEVHGYVDLVKT